MRRRLGALLVAPVMTVGLLVAAPGATPAGAATYSVAVTDGLCYQAVHGTCVDGASHEFDAYLPVGTKGRIPAVVVIHGGGFIGGDKSQVSSIATKLAANGMAAFSVNYRLDSATVVGFPMESQDVMTAIAYLRTHAGKFHVDPTRIASLGTSAGATLAVYSAMKAQQGDPAAGVVADVGWSGGYDFTVGTSGAVDPTQLQHVEYYLGCSDPTDPTCAATAAAASATTLVQPDDPPTLLANSTDYQVGCEIVDPAQATGMAADLQAAGVPVQLDLNNLCAHAQGYGSYEMPRTLSFLEAHLFRTPVFRTGSSRTFKVGVAKSFTVKTKSSGDPPATLTETGALPTGLTFTDRGDGTAVLGGTPAPGTQGSYPLTFTADNGSVPDATQAFTLVVSGNG